MVNLAELRKKKKKEDEKKEEIKVEKEEKIENLKEKIDAEKVEKSEVKEEKTKIKEIDLGREEEKKLYLSFTIGKEIYGLPIDYVQEIVPVHPITKVPNSSKEILGIICLRGQVLPVIDLGVFLGQCVENITNETRLIIVKIKDEVISIIVDKVNQNISIPADEIEPAPNTVKDERGLIEGIYLFKKKLIILLKPEQL